MYRNHKFHLYLYISEPLLIILVSTYAKTFWLIIFVHKIANGLMSILGYAKAFDTKSRLSSGNSRMFENCIYVCKARSGFEIDEAYSQKKSFSTEKQKILLISLQLL